MSESLIQKNAMLGALISTGIIGGLVTLSAKLSKDNKYWIAGGLAGGLVMEYFVNKSMLSESVQISYEEIKKAANNFQTGSSTNYEESQYKFLSNALMSALAVVTGVGIVVYLKSYSNQPLEGLDDIVNQLQQNLQQRQNYGFVPLNNPQPVQLNLGAPPSDVPSVPNLPSIPAGSDPNSLQPPQNSASILGLLAASSIISANPGSRNFARTIVANVVTSAAVSALNSVVNSLTGTQVTDVATHISNEVADVLSAELPGISQRSGQITLIEGDNNQQYAVVTDTNGQQFAVPTLKMTQQLFDFVTADVEVPPSPVRLRRSIIGARGGRGAGIVTEDFEFEDIDQSNIQGMVFDASSDSMTTLSGQPWYEMNDQFNYVQTMEFLKPYWQHHGYVVEMQPPSESNTISMGSQSSETLEFHTFYVLSK